MRAWRFLGYAVVLAVAVIVTAVVAVRRNQSAIAEIALARIRDRTGLDIRITGTRIAFGSHLVVVLTQPRVLREGAEVARLKDIRAVLSYRAILHNSGLPLDRLVLDEPRARIPANSANVTPGGIAHFDAAAVIALRHALESLSDTVQHVEVVDAALVDESDSSIAEHLDLHAYRRHYRHSGDWPWIVDFDATLAFAPITATRVSGKLELGARRDQPTLVSSGRVWFWNLKLTDFNLGAANISAGVGGEVEIAIDQEGVLSGSAKYDVRELSVSGRRLSNVLRLGSSVVAISYRASPQELDLPSVTIHGGNSRLLLGNATITRPYDPDRAIAFSASGMRLSLTTLGSWLRAVRDLPSRFVQIASGFDSGELVVSQIAFDSPQTLNQLSIAKLRDNLRATATVTDTGYRLPDQAKLPPIKKLAGQFTYEAGRLELAQGSLEIGGSRLTHLSSTAKFKRAPTIISYKVDLAADLDIGEIYPAAADLARAANPAVSDHIKTLGGRVLIALNASGDLRNFQWSAPRDYLATLDLSQATVGAKDLPADLAFRQGNLILKPGVIDVNHVRITPVGTQRGEAILNGEIVPQQTGFPRMQNFTIEMHSLAIEQWLPLFVQPEDLAADGSIGGVLTANSTSAAANGFPVVTGKLTLGAGHLQLGFLRSPMVTRAATLVLDGKGLTLDIPGCKIENAPLDFRLSVADLSHPAVRLDAKAAKLDFEVMRFIRLPWSRHTPPTFFAVPISGHIEANEANFAKLPLSRVATDFTKAGNDWRVYNFTATVLGGGVKLEITGRSRDDWIRMVGTIDAMDAAQLSTMTAPNRPPILTGKLSANGDLWGHTDVDFFESLAGSASVHVSDGVLNRLTLLTRILGLVDLKSWLTAQFPDPRIAGLPFTTLSGDFTGTGGDFKTDNLRLDGPVLNISAQGDVNFGREQMDMDLGVFPFKTANWIVHQIPIIGTNLAGGTYGLVAAYFHVYGPFKNPWIIPKPISSVTQFVKKMLGLPINLIVPNTIK